MQEPIDKDKIDEVNASDEVSKERPVSNPSLQQELADYKKALEEEWGQSNLELPENHEALVEATRKEIIRGIPKAVTNIVYLAEHADNENVRLKACMYLTDNGLGEGGKFNPEDPLDKLVKQLTAPSAPPTEQSET